MTSLFSYDINIASVYLSIIDSTLFSATIKTFPSLYLLFRLSIKEVTFSSKSLSKALTLFTISLSPTNNKAVPKEAIEVSV